jgi:hypothetical protein
MHEGYLEQGQPADDVERLLARLEPVSPPPDLATRVLARTTRGAGGRRWTLVALGVGLLAAGLAAANGYAAGHAFVQSGAYELLRLAVEDWELVAAAPTDYLLALAEAVPWRNLVVSLACVAAAYAVARPLAGGLCRTSKEPRP